jgi:GNAT superfamily N-acetyltransferase
MSSYTLVSPTASDIPRIATIQQAAFAEDPLTIAALANVSKEDYISWCHQVHSRPDPPPGYKLEFVCAKNTDTGEIAGWAQWAIPLEDGEEWKGDEKREKVPLPKGADKMMWNDFFESIQNHERRIMEGRKHWGMSPTLCSGSWPSAASITVLFILVVDPDFQRRGIGKALVSDGVQKAHAQGLPLFICASPKGVFLYKSLGFEVKDTPKVTGAEIVANMMVNEPKDVVWWSRSNNNGKKDL